MGSCQTRATLGHAVNAEGLCDVYTCVRSSRILVTSGLIAGALLAAACDSVVDSTSTTVPAVVEQETTTTTPITTSTTGPSSTGGQLVKLDPQGLEPVPGLVPFPIGSDSWNLMSRDGSFVVNIEWDDQRQLSLATAYDVDRWVLASRFELGNFYGSATVSDGMLYTYYPDDGRLAATELTTGVSRIIGEWPRHLALWYDLLVLDSDRIATIAAGPGDSGSTTKWSLYTHDAESAESRVFPIGELERRDSDTGIFDGDYEIERVDVPAVVWDESRVYIVHAKEPTVSVVDLETGDIESTVLDATTWWDRIVAYWMPTAAAKGPSLGIYTSAALTPDGRYLFVSGNEVTPVQGEDGTLLEETHHLGLTVVDTESMELVSAPELPIQFVADLSGTIFGIDTTSITPWEDDYYLLTVGETGQVEHRGPFSAAGGGCQPVSGSSRLLCTGQGSSSTNTLLIDITTGESTEGPSLDWEDSLHPNGVLEDWFPRHEP